MNCYTTTVESPCGPLFCLVDENGAVMRIEFEMRVWRALLGIPYGETRSYGQLAAGLGSTNAARAVGLANSRNPIAVVVPCHRVIGADGSLTGFAGGMARKRWLLVHERGVAGEAKGEARQLALLGE